MARPKPLLGVGALTFIERAVRTMRVAGCRNIYVVVNKDATWAEEEATRLDFITVVNPKSDSEQIDSVRLVLAQLPEDTAAILMMPVDLPLIMEETAAAVVAEFRKVPGPLILPFHNGVAGHPVLLGRELFDEIQRYAFDEGIRSVIMGHARDLHEVTVVDPGILIDIDTPDDYKRNIEDQ